MSSNSDRDIPGEPHCRPEGPAGPAEAPPAGSGAAVPAPAAGEVPAAIIRAVGLVKRYGERLVLDGLDLDVREGETMVIMGGSGCGKTTLLRLMIGSTWPDEGHIELFGQDLSKMTDDELDGVRKRFGVLFQSGALFNSMTVGENISLPLREHTDLDDETIDIMVRIKLEQVGLRDAAGLMPAQLSGGMRKRAALARAIALDPKILFYDEPTTGLDPVTSAQIDELLMALAGRLGITSVAVTHEMDSAFRIADRMAVMDAGRILKVGPRSEFEAVRDGEPTGNHDTDLLRQFLRGEPQGPLGSRRPDDGFEKDLLRAAGAT
jgi:phospholipid/cholesterol/gamma-HCH transport system ATP-binding protein